MAYIFKTEQFKTKDIIEAALKVIQQLEKRVLIEPNGKHIAELDRENKIIVYRGFHGDKFRIIIQKFEDNSLPEPIYFLRDYFAPQDYNIWQRKISPSIISKEWINLNPLAYNEVELAKKKLLSIYNKKETKPDIEPYLFDWVNTVDGMQGFEVTFKIFEYKDWVDFVNEQRTTNFRPYFFGLVKSIVSNNNVASKAFPLIGNRKLYYFESGDYFIIYEEHIDDNTKLIHNGGFTTDTDIEEKKDIAKKSYGFKDNYKIVKAYDINFSAKSAYNYWVNIQIGDKSSNLALLPEQKKIINNLKYPVFITGQAGSGKSTILYYLFAFIYERKKYFSDGEKISLLFLTHNLQLLKLSEGNINDLLLNNSNFTLDAEDINIDKYFYPFHLFLLEKCISEEDKDKFPEQQYLNFSLFKRKYKKEFLDKKQKIYNAEFVWYVISTYIEGYDKNTVMTPTNQILYEHDKNIITNEIFRDIYEIWSSFYKKKIKEEQKYWDRIDLVKFILTNYNEIPFKATVIICDEAQDFTKLEYSLLIKTSEYTNYKLTQKTQIPLIFAGDPLQTVNPTGFNLNTIKTLIREQLPENAKPDNIVESLEYNYRSKKGIVNLANIVQLFRKDYLKRIDIQRPQKSFQEGGEIPLYFLEDEFTEIQQQLEHAVFIVPCEENEEGNYFKYYKKLDVQSTILAKGSEYKTVVVSYFGNYLIENNLIESFRKICENTQPSFEISFFFNKLYVAITRAVEEIIILDTKDGIEQFWKKITNNIIYKDKLDILFDSKSLRKGMSGDLKETNRTEALRNAKELEEKGKLFEDPERLKQAAKKYKNVNEINKSDDCMAHALKFEHRWSDAGECFSKINKNEEANDCYWIAGENYWQKIDFNSSDLVDEHRKFIINLYKKNVIDFNFFYDKDILTEIENSEFSSYIKWKQEFYTKLHSFFKGQLNKLSKADCEEIAERLSTIAIHEYDDRFIDLIADIYFKAEKYSKTVEIWNNFKDETLQKNDNYWIAKSKESGSSEEDKIFALNEVKEKEKNKTYEQIIILYKNNTRIAEQLDIVFEAFCRKNRFTEAIKVGIVKFDWRNIPFDKINIDSMLEEFANYLSDTHEIRNEFNRYFFEQILRFLQNNSNFKKLLSDYKKLSTTDKNKELNKIKFSVRESGVIRDLIKIIAHSEINPSDFPNTLNNEKIFPFENFFSNYFLLYKTDRGVQALINPIEYTIACERTIGLYNNLLDIYEHILDKDKSHRNYYCKRLLKIKQKQIYHNQFDKKGVRKPDGKGIFDSKLIEVEVNKELESYAKKIKFSLSNFDEVKKYDEYPTIAILSKRTNISNESDNLLLELNNQVFDYLLKLRIDKPDLYFSTRDIADISNLEKGYWFEGENNEIFLTFWDGRDKVNKNLPSINFVIKSDGKCILELNADDSPENAKFFEALDIIKNFKRRSSGTSFINRWQKEFSKSDYKENIDELLKNEKTEIDRTLNFALKYNKFESLKFIKSSDFNNRIRTIEKYRNGETQFEETNEQKENRLVINSIELENIGQFEKLKIEFNSRVTVIIGENGLGKSTIMSSIPLALIGVDNNTLINKKSQTIQDKLRIKSFQKGKEYYLKGYIKLRYTLDKEYVNTIEFSNQIQPVPEDIGDFILNTNQTGTIKGNGDYLTHLVIGFPQGQGKNYEKNPENIFENKPNISDILPLIMYYQDNRINSFKTWIKTRFDSNERKAIDKVFNIISLILTDNTNEMFIEFIDIIPQENRESIVVVRFNNKENSLDLLSQGLTNVFTWIGVFVSRLYQVYGERFENDIDRICKEASAVLFVDEIDTYLHPKWQRSILKVLMRIFENTQIIVSTHSPFILEDLEQNQILYLRLNGNQIECITNKTDILGWHYNEILNKWMDIRFDFSKYNLDELEEELNNLIETGGNENEVFKLQESINRIKQSKIAANELEALKQRLLKREEELIETIKQIKK